MNICVRYRLLNVMKHDVCVPYKCKVYDQIEKINDIKEHCSMFVQTSTTCDHHAIERKCQGAADPSFHKNYSKMLIFSSSFFFEDIN